MQILMIAINDPAGTAIEFTKAVNKYTNHTCRLITKEIRYNFMFEKDLHLPWLDEDGWAEVERLLITSDVFHFHMTADEHTELGPFRPVDYLKGKRIVHHHHGHPDFRSNPGLYREKYKKLGRLHLLVSTPDLLELLPEARWQPNLVPINEPLYTPTGMKTEERVIICHSPTRKDLKNTVEFVQAAEILKKECQVPIELRMIEDTPHLECLKLKRESHILFDHMQGYFGVSSLEALSQGLCVIAGLKDSVEKEIRETMQAERLPWVVARDCEQLSRCLKRAVSDTNFREYNGMESRRFMEAHWTDRQVLKVLLDNMGGLSRDYETRQSV